MKRFYCLIFLLWTALAQGETVLSASTDNPKSSLHYLALSKFNELIAQYSDNELTSIIAYRGSKDTPAIRGEEVNVNMVTLKRKSNVDITVVAVGNAARKLPLLQFLTLPYLFPDFDSAKRLFSSSFMEHDINNRLADKYDVKIIGWLIGGFRHMSNSVKPVKTLADLKGLKIRTPKNQVMLASYRLFGANVKPISWSETFSALKSGQVDGQENPYSVMVDSKFWLAKQKYITNNGPFLWVGPIMMNLTVYKSLPLKLQQIIDRAGKEAAEFEWDWIAQKNSDFAQVLRSHGMLIDDLDDKPDWIKLGSSIWEQYYLQIGDGDIEVGEKIVANAVKITQ